MSRGLVVVRGGGDLGSGVALRLWRCGFLVAILESHAPLAVRRTVSYAEAVFSGETRVEESTGRLFHSLVELPDARDVIPVLVDPGGGQILPIRPLAVVDAIMAKRNVNTGINLAPIVVALGPGFTAGVDAHAVIETNRGPNLGRVLYHGAAEPNTGIPGSVSGRGADRVLRAPVTGQVRGVRNIGDRVQAGETVAVVNDTPVNAPFMGVVRGLVHDGLNVAQGTKIGDIDPRLDPALCFRVSDKALAVAGGVLEAILSSEVSEL